MNDRERLDTDPLLLRRHPRVHEADRGLHAPSARGRAPLPVRPLGWLERLIYRAVRRRRPRTDDGTSFSLALLAFSLFSMVVTYAIQRLQGVLPFNPQHLGAVEQASSFNTAASFTTNTNWQGYVGEATMSYLSQMAGLAWHNFTSAAAGIAVAMALARGLTRRGEGTKTGTIGNFWVDTTRAIVYILLPLSFVFALVFASQGVHPEPCPLSGSHDPRGREAGDRDGPGGLPGGRSSSWARTAAASSTPTPPIPSRAPTRSRTSCRCSSSS